MEKLDGTKFMIGLVSAPRDYNKCKDCGGTGAKHIICCTGSDCGCMGKPTDYVKCDCGREFPSDEKIYEWYTKMKESYEKDMKTYMTKEDLT